ncbi:hypothetical protein IU397_13375 [Actibacterium sp. 188UL27-1]|nr:hypothetical protein [Actibacterium sp. 188UL27-1]MBM7068575.1 hypothetical protein [Actibacterium sp. 188UL27-1]
MRRCTASSKATIVYGRTTPRNRTNGVPVRSSVPSQPCGSKFAARSQRPPPKKATAILTESRTQVWDWTVPTDPCVHRLYEIVGVYGPTIKPFLTRQTHPGLTELSP